MLAFVSRTALRTDHPVFCTLTISSSAAVFQVSGQILDGDHIPDPDEGHERPLRSKGNRNRAGTGVVEKRDEEMC